MRYGTENTISMSRRYTLSNLQKSIGNPSLMVHELKRVARKPRNIAFERKYGPGIDVMAEDWDNLILLDACRYDYFESQINIEGELKSAISRGGHSWEFMQGNFVGREFHDTIYVTANPHVEKLSDGTFF